MNTMQVTCCMCGGSGCTMKYRPVSSDGVITTLQGEEVRCESCNGKGWAEYAVFSIEEAKAILKHCGLSTES